MREVAWALGPVLASVLAGFLGARLAHRPEADPSGEPPRDRTGGLTSALLTVIGALGLVLAGVVVLVQDKPVPFVSVLFAGMLGLGLVDHFSERQRVPHPRTEPGEFWWTGLAVPFGLGTWGCFAYLGIRFRHPRLLLVAACYLVPIVASYLSASDKGEGGIGTAIWFGVWLVGGLHGYVIRGSVRQRFAEMSIHREIDPSPTV